MNHMSHKVKILNFLTIKKIGVRDEIIFSSWLSIVTNMYNVFNNNFSESTKNKFRTEIIPTHCFLLFIKIMVALFMPRTYMYLLRRNT